MKMTYQHKGKEKTNRQSVQLGVSLAIFLVVLLGRNTFLGEDTALGEQVSDVFRADTEFAAEAQRFWTQISQGEGVAQAVNVFLAGEELPVTPVEGTITSSFGQRLDPMTEQLEEHCGVDIAAEEGTAILACRSGTVLSVGETGEYGRYLELDHGDGFTTFYAHCSEVLVAEGDPVAAGSEIARVGQTGKATGPHLHFETRQDGSAFDPTEYLNLS